MTTDEYRNKWELPSDYRMTAPAYSRSKGQSVWHIGLGRYKR